MRSEVVRRRLVAVAEAPAVLELFMVHWSATVHTWPQYRIARDSGATALEHARRP